MSKRILAPIATLLLMLGLCAGITGAHAATSKATIGKAVAQKAICNRHIRTVTWSHTGHSVKLNYEYDECGGIAYQSGGAQTFSCDPSDSTYWDRTVPGANGQNVDGQLFRYYNENISTGAIFTKDEILNGGNITDCSHQFSYTFGGDEVDSGCNLRMRYKYRFQTNYNNPANDVNPTIVITMPGANCGGGGGGGGGGGSSSCGGAVLTGAGTLSDCIEIGVVPL